MEENEKKEDPVKIAGPYDNVKISVKILDRVIAGGIIAAVALILISVF
ncbi:hypothetical protein LJC18_01335 [Lachnospiraceae bacterium OttesenSCG-928-E19]|nr:hypothetical protein [Lachnospiraceae bacterium OttesenSCG-928-E19]